MLAKGFGGAERSFVDLAQVLARLGHEVQAICHEKFSAREQLAGVEHIELVTVSPIARWDLRAARRVSRSIESFAPSVVHAHLARAAWTAGYIKRRGGPPLIAKTHNYVKMKYYRKVDHFIATTDRQVRYLADNGIASANVSLIPNFSQLEPIAEAHSLAAGAPVTFVSIGRFVDEKAFEVLVRAFRGVVAEYPTSRLIIAGDGPAKVQIGRQVQAHGLTDNVSLPGWCDDVRDLLQSADVFVLPSRRESFGIAVLEAMSAGVSIITTRTHGPSEILDAESARFVDIDDPEALTEAMLQAVREPQIAMQRAERALEHYRDRYHCDVVVPKIVDAYQRLTQNG